METVVQKKRNTKKRAVPIELPQSISNQYLRVGNLLRHSLARKWIRYEFQYDEIEDAYFNKNGTFDIMLLTKFPRLKTSGLTAVEWHKVRSLIIGKYQRRFSSQFVQQQRVDFERYRQAYNLLSENNCDDQLMKLKAPVESVSVNELIAYDESPQIEMFRLMIKARKLLAIKSELVAGLRDIISLKDKIHNEEGEASHANAIETITKLRKCNDGIMNCLSKLVRFQLVKDTLMFDAMEKKRLYLPMSPVYFRRNCELRIYEDHCEYQSDISIVDDLERQLLDMLLELSNALIDSVKLATNAIEYAKDVAQEHSDALVHTMTPSDFKYFDECVLPTYFNIFCIMCACAHLNIS